MSDITIALSNVFKYLDSWEYYVEANYIEPDAYVVTSGSINAVNNVLAPYNNLSSLSITPFVNSISNKFNTLTLSNTTTITNIGSVAIRLDSNDILTGVYGSTSINSVYSGTSRLLQSNSVGSENNAFASYSSVLSNLRFNSIQSGLTNLNPNNVLPIQSNYFNSYVGSLDKSLSNVLPSVITYSGLESFGVSSDSTVNLSGDAAGSSVEKLSSVTYKSIESTGLTTDIQSILTSIGFGLTPNTIKTELSDVFVVYSAGISGVQFGSTVSSVTGAAALPLRSNNIFVELGNLDHFKSELSVMYTSRAFTKTDYADSSFTKFVYPNSEFGIVDNFNTTFLPVITANEKFTKFDYTTSNFSQAIYHKSKFTDVDKTMVGAGKTVNANNQFTNVIKTTDSATSQESTVSEFTNKSNAKGLK
jgi:hypothetical protein